MLLYSSVYVLRADHVAIAKPRVLSEPLVALQSQSPIVRFQASIAIPRQAPAPAPSVTVAGRMLTRYCVTCHNEKLVAAGRAPMRLDTVDLDRVGEHAALLEKVLRKLRTGEMPPPRLPRPDDATYETVTAYLEAELDRAATAAPNPGRPTVRRLNRSEYANAIRDVLALEVDATELLPAETQAYGFDNIGDVLSMSPNVFQRYLSAARKVSSLAVGDIAVGPTVKTYSPSRVLLQDGDRMSEDLPFGSRGGIAVRHHFPVDGEYSIRVMYTNPRAHDEHLDIRVDGARLALVPLSKSGGRGSVGRNREASKEIRFEAKAGTRTLAVTYIKSTQAYEGVAPGHLPSNVDGSAASLVSTVTRVAVGGPYKVHGAGDTPSRREIFVCRPAAARDEDACASKILARLARRAYRRPVAAGDIQPLITFYKDARKEGATFDGGIQQALVGLLVDPRFLFRIEQDPGGPGRMYRLSDIELASRVSFFLWSTIPDEELLSLAERGKLSDPNVLERQVRRMLADDRASALVENFAAQWLYLRNLQQHAPDLNRFPEFNHNLRDAFRRETDLFLESQLRDDRPVAELLGANYTFVNERLAQHYGIPNVYGSHFRRVTLTDENRFGLLGQGSILALTSSATRTSVVVRGNWLLTNMLDSPAPPPPPDVPALEEGEKKRADGKTVTLREKMEQHRKNPACSVCHARMDPLGFALENFDAVGRWRTLDGDSPIDATGELPGGIKLAGPVGVRQFLLSRREQFATTIASRLLVYATGRGVEYYDMPTIRKIVRESASTDYRWSSIILRIVKSAPFQMRVKEPSL